MMSCLRSILRFLWSAFVLAALAGGLLWSIGALYFDFPIHVLRPCAALLFGAGAVALLALVRPHAKARGCAFAAVALVAAWWWTLSPQLTRDWQPDVAEMAWAEIAGDTVTLHNVRNCEYHYTDRNYTPRWETRTLDLSKLTGVDIAIDYWGSPWIAHPIVSFQFADGPPLAISIETRKQAGEEYSALAGLYRGYELIYIAADERDVFRVRTNYRQGEDLYLYHTTLGPDEARKRLLEYLAVMNRMKTEPRWYNAITTNCTSAIRSQHAEAGRLPWDWRMLLNGKLDEFLFERGMIERGGLPFTELKERALINNTAKAADSSADFSSLIRADRPGFDSPPVHH